MTRRLLGEVERRDEWRINGDMRSASPAAHSQVIASFLSYSLRALVLIFPWRWLFGSTRNAPLVEGVSSR